MDSKSQKTLPDRFECRLAPIVPLPEYAVVEMLGDGTANDIAYFFCEGRAKQYAKFLNREHRKKASDYERA